MKTLHIAQVNIGRMKGALEDPVMAGIDEAKKRLAHLDAHGPTPFAFTFKDSFPPDEQFVNGTDWSSFKPCPAT